jgi:16S rRNA (cytosine967-C5)-methyltransferase
VFDGIIADVPCSGSGTWARTPERLRFFTSHELDAYVALQESITNNLIPSLRIGGVLVYITCSVFEVENGGRVSKLQAGGQLELVEEHLLQGSGHGADTLYCALLRRIA